MWPELHFIRPEWFWGIPVVIAASVYLARRRLSDGSWIRIIDPVLAPHVLSGAQKSGNRLPWWLMAVVGTLACVTLAGPAFERIEQPVFRSDQALVIGLDLSYSMDAQDVAPSRLLRARLKILDLLYLSHYVDPYYAANRKNLLVVAYGCWPDERCFCDSLGTSNVDDGFDLALTPLEGRFLVTIATSKGDARRSVQGGGVYLNNRRVSDTERSVTAEDALEGRFIVLRKGKKRYPLVKVLT